MEFHQRLMMGRQWLFWIPEPFVWWNPFSWSGNRGRWSTREEMLALEERVTRHLDEHRTAAKDLQ